MGSLGLDRMQWGENLNEEKVQAEHNTVDIGFKKCARQRLQILGERILGEAVVVYILLPRIQGILRGILWGILQGILWGILWGILQGILWGILWGILQGDLQGDPLGGPPGYPSGDPPGDPLGGFPGGTLPGGHD